MILRFYFKKKNDTNKHGFYAMLKKMVTKKEANLKKKKIIYTLFSVSIS